METENSMKLHFNNRLLLAQFNKTDDTELKQEDANSAKAVANTTLRNFGPIMSGSLLSGILLRIGGPEARL